MKKSIGFSVSGVVLTMALLTGCGSAAPTTTGSAPSSTTGDKGVQIPEKDKDYVVQIGYYNCDHMTAAPIAKDVGIYDSLGLKVNVTGNGKVPEAMAAGKMDVGYIGTEGLLNALGKGAPVVVAANNHLGGAYYLVVSNNIKDPKELIGKKLAIGKDPEKNSSSWVSMATKLGIPVEGKNYQTFVMADKDEYLALKTGNLDGYTTCDPWASMAEYEKTGRIIAIDEKLPTGDWGSCCVLAMSKSFANDHQVLAEKMILAHSKALEYIYTHPYKSAEIFADNYKVPAEVGLMTIYKKTIGEGRTLTWEINKKNFQDEVANDFKLGTIPSAPAPEEFINTELLAKAGTDNFADFIKEKVDPVFPLGMSYEDWKKKAAEIDGKSS